MDKQQIDILLVTGGDSISGATRIDKLLQVLPDDKSVYLVTRADARQLIGIDRSQIMQLPPTRPGGLGFFGGQVDIFKSLVSIFKNHKVATVMFAMGNDLQLMPMLLSKALGKRVIIRSDGRPTVVLAQYGGCSLKSRLFRVIEEIDYRLADTIVTNCDGMIKANGLGGYRTRRGCGISVDPEVFYCDSPLENRQYDVGFVGRLSAEKGFPEFVAAIQTMNVKPIIIGDGPERDKADGVGTCTGWVSQGELPAYLNQIKVLVVPSYKEGLPNVVLEGMACGCVVLSTPVGGIPWIVKDGLTGFIMDNNTPGCIRRNIRRVLNHPGIEEISKRGRYFIEDEFNVERVVEAYRDLLAETECKK